MAYKIYKPTNRGKKSETWWVRVSQPGIAEPVRRSAGTKIKSHAIEFAKKIDEELWHQLKLGTVGDFYWEQLVVKWAAHVKQKQNRAIHNCVLRLKVLDKYLAGKKLKSLTKKMLNEVFDDIAETRELSNGTLNLYIGLVKYMLNLAFLEFDMLDKPPVINKRKPRTQRQ